MKKAVPEISYEHESLRTAPQKTLTSYITLFLIVKLCIILNDYIYCSNNVYGNICFIHLMITIYHDAKLLFFCEYDLS